ncbi:MAG: hypothetical protein BRC32_02430, partial [Actinobacteria bacterium QS_8_72_14]
SIAARVRRLPRDRPIWALAIAIVTVEVVGASGAVFTAQGLGTWYETLQRPVAVKVLRQGTAEERQRFESESRAQAPLSHPSIVRVFDVGTHEERPFLVMAHVDGRALSTVLSDGPLSSERVTRLGGQLSEALAHAHERGVIHRDVKPGNVLVDDNDYAYLTDFGIARHTDSATVTAPGRFVGSAAYVAPEQARGETVTAAAEVLAQHVAVGQACVAIDHHCARLSGPVPAGPAHGPARRAGASCRRRGASFRQHSHRGDGGQRRGGQGRFAELPGRAWRW